MEESNGLGIEEISTSSAKPWTKRCFVIRTCPTLLLLSYFRILTMGIVHEFFRFPPYQQRQNSIQNMVRTEMSRIVDKVSWTSATNSDSVQPIQMWSWDFFYTGFCMMPCQCTVSRHWLVVLLLLLWISPIHHQIHWSIWRQPSNSESKTRKTPTPHNSLRQSRHPSSSQTN